MRGNLLPSLVVCALLLTSATPGVLSQSVAGNPAGTRPKPAALSLPSLLQRKVLARSALRKRAVPLLAAAPVEKSPFLPVVDQSDILLKHRRIADEVLRRMPEQCQGALRNFYVRYDHPKERGLAGKESIVMSGNVSDEEFRALFIHEFSHVMDLGCLTGSPAQGQSVYRDGSDIMWNDDPSVRFYAISWAGTTTQHRWSAPEDFVTGYASWDPFEDIAESIAYYVLQQDAFQMRALENRSMAAKLAWIETYVFPQGIDVAEGLHTWRGTVPWDVTKLLYVWKGL